MLSQIQNHLSAHPWKNRIQYFDTIDSTNTYAKLLAADGAPEGTVVIAAHQSGGRGRMGRSFSSPTGMGIYLSVLLRPGCRPAELMHLTCAAGLAACFAIEETTGIRPGIKWTNDLILERKKLGGILTEISIDPATLMVDWAIVGIGINCCQKETDFPPEIRDIAISLGLPAQIQPQLTASLIRQIHTMRNDLLPRKAQTMQTFTGHCITIGQEISILRGNEVHHGKAIGVDMDGGLQVQLDDGNTTTVTSGEVSIRGMYGYV